MPQLSRLIDELKSELRRQRITYAEVATHLALSESSIKKMFARRSFTAQRLEQVCNFVGLELSDLIDLMNAEQPFLTELSAGQEDALLEEPKLLLLAYLLINRWPLSEIVKEYLIEPGELDRLLIRLHRIRIIELLPLNRFKLLTARHFTWRKDGPVQQLFENLIQREFLASTFSEPTERLRFVGGTLSRSSIAHLRQSIDKLAREFDDLSRQDAALPIAERNSCGAVFAIRPWEFSVFKELRRPSK